MRTSKRKYFSHLVLDNLPRACSYSLAHCRHYGLSPAMSADKFPKNIRLHEVEPNFLRPLAPAEDWHLILCLACMLHCLA